VGLGKERRLPPTEAREKEIRFKKNIELRGREEVGKTPIDSEEKTPDTQASSEPGQSTSQIPDMWENARELCLTEKVSPHYKGCEKRALKKGEGEPTLRGKKPRHAVQL